MVQASGLSRLGRGYVSTVIVLGLAIVLGSVYQMCRGQVPPQWFLIAALTLVSGSASVRLPFSDASISISEAFVFLAILLYGPAAGTVVVVLDGLVISFWLAKRHKETYRAFFNMSAGAVSGWCSAQLFFLASGLAPLATRPATLNQVLPSLALATFAYFALNTWLITFAIALTTQVNPAKLWMSSFAWLSLTYFSGASVAALVAVYNGSLDVGFIGVIVPLLLIFYFTFRTTKGRLEDADRHVGELNSLYLSTIETLAMAIDAKDQVTHGHIRRVQTYAVGLAKFVGVTDKGQIKAIEAAALLHDMGKLAVPEYILNKPGKLTPAEFEKMKLHASVGADILSAIAFPYPVVPIVRHHHECWDGAGYPRGLAGTDIPIGARILAVVDCFDALTSDRPYRPRLSDEEAVVILLERRGSMYDPLIVDTFVRVRNEITIGTLPSHTHDALHEISNSAQDPLALPGAPRLDEIAASADEMLTLYELARGLAGQASISDTGDVIANHLRRLIPSSLCIFFLYDTETDDLEAAHAFGEASSMVRGFRIPLGQRLSGWVAANQQTIVNSDPSLDLGDVARAVTPRLRSCLSTPLLSGDELVGVLTVYSAIVDGFNEDHRRIIEAVAKQISHTFRRAADFDRRCRRDPLTGLPNVAQLEHVMDSSSTTEPGENHAVTLLLLDVVELKRINALYGRDAGDEALRHVARHTRASLRIGDLLFRHASDEFVVLLNEADAQTAATIALRIRDNVQSQPVTLNGGKPIAIDVTITRVVAPADGGSFPDLLATARARVHSLSSSPISIH